MDKDEWLIQDLERNIACLEGKLQRAYNLRDGEGSISSHSDDSSQAFIPAQRCQKPSTHAYKRRKLLHTQTSNSLPDIGSTPNHQPTPVKLQKRPQRRCKQAFPPILLTEPLSCASRPQASSSTSVLATHTISALSKQLETSDMTSICSPCITPTKNIPAVCAIEFTTQSLPPQLPTNIDGNLQCKRWREELQRAFLQRPLQLLVKSKFSDIIRVQY